MIYNKQDYDKQLLQQFKGFLNTPLLWSSPSFFKVPQLDLPQVDSGNLDEFQLQVPKRLILGKRAECFFQYCLERYANETILASNIQVRWDKQTIGEIDFLLRNKQSRRVAHVEVVYKFYLYDPTLEWEMARWIGPNRRDSLIKKLSKLKDHQFPLLFRKETKPHLEKLGLTTDQIVQYVCFKANLFVPFHHEEYIPHINREAIVGFWIKRSEFTSKQFGDSVFFSPKKTNWPIHPASNSKWYDFEEIYKQLLPLLEQKRSPLVWMKKRNNQYSRFFIVWW